MSDQGTNKEQLDRIEAKLDEMIAFKDALIASINGAASAPGMQGMMVRNMLPPQLLAMATPPSSNGHEG